MESVGRIFLHRDTEGKSDVTIVDESCLPICFFLTSYMDDSISQVINTKKTYATQLLFIYRYFDGLKIDIPARVGRGEYFAPEEYEKFKRHCSYRDMDWTKAGGNVSSFKQFSDKQLDIMIHASASSSELVSAHTIKLRLSLFANYVRYLYELNHLTAEQTSDVKFKYDTLMRKISDDRWRIKPQNKDVRDPFDSVIPDAIYSALKECIEPFSPNNPFTLTSRQRNYLIVKLAIEGGLRRAAIAKLKLSDIKNDWFNPRIRITRTPDDSSDTRLDRPSQKTKAHVTALSKDTMKRLIAYLEHERSTYPVSHTHDFVFVAEKGPNKGKPLSLKGFDYVFSRLGKHLGFHLTAHMIRHKWNEEFDDAAVKRGYSDEKKEDIRKGAMGWSENSKMSEIYNAKSNAVNAQKIQQHMQREQFSKDENNDS